MTDGAGDVFRANRQNLLLCKLSCSMSLTVSHRAMLVFSLVVFRHGLPYQVAGGIVRSVAIQV